MALEAVLRPDLLFGKRYPVVHAVGGLDVVGVGKKRVYNAIKMESPIILPSIIRKKELVAIIQPVSINAMANRYID